MLRSLITIQIFIFCFSLFLTGCKRDHSIIQPDLNNPEIHLSLNRVKVKEVWLDLTVNTKLDSSKVTVYRDSVLIFESSKKGIDTTLYDYNLIPKNNYFYQAYLYSKEVLIDSSNELNLKTKEYEWKFLGLQDTFALNLKVADSYLYVCGGVYGLFRYNIYNPYGSWEYLGLADTSLGFYINRGVQDVLIYSHNHDWLLASFAPDIGTDCSVFRSFNGGLNWEPADSGLVITIGSYTLNFHLHRFLQYSNLIIAGGHGVWYSEDFGGYWQYYTIDFGGWVYAFENHRLYPNNIWLGSQMTGFDPLLAYSSDTGQNWTLIDLSQVVPVDNGVYSIAFDQFDPNTVYVGMQGAIIKTVDSGQTWISPLVTHPLGYFYRAILSDPNNAFHLWAVAGTDFIETWDKGATWQTIDNPIPQNTGVFDMVWHDNTETIYIATLDGVYSLEP